MTTTWMFVVALVLAGNLPAERNLKNQVFGLAGRHQNDVRQAEAAVEHVANTVRGDDSESNEKAERVSSRVEGQPLLGKIVGVEMFSSQGLDDPAILVPVQDLLSEYGGMVTARMSNRNSSHNQTKCEGMAVDICVQIGRVAVPRQEETHVNRNGNTRIRGQNIGYGGGHRTVRSEAYVQVQFWGFRGNAPMLYAAKEADGTVKSGSSRYDVRTSGHGINLGQSGGGLVRSDARFLGYRAAVVNAVDAAVAEFVAKEAALRGRGR